MRRRAGTDPLAISAWLLACLAAAGTHATEAFVTDDFTRSSSPASVQYVVQPETEQPESPWLPPAAELGPAGRSPSPVVAASPWLSFFQPAALARSRRLSRAPNIFGDFFLPLGSVELGDPLGAIPPPGGRPPTADEIPPSISSRMKVAENNNTLPWDRVYFNYNHYHHALQSNFGSSVIAEHSVSQYTLGFEKTFQDGLWSVELRLPLYSPDSFPTILGGPGDAFEGSALGNLSIIAKRLLLLTDSSAVAAGLGMAVPTGDDVHYEALDLELSNDSVHLVPYFAMLSTPGDVFFGQAFLQIDTATHGNLVTSGSAGRLGRLNPQTLLAADASVGAWLHRDPAARRLRGVAAILELHYTTTLQDTDVARQTFMGADLFRVRNTGNRLDVLNLTTGIHLEVGRTTIQAGAAFPLRDGFDRLFDAEVLVAINRYF